MAFQWLKETRKLQTRSFGVDPTELRGDALADFVIWNHTALIDELSEALAEIRWKPWVAERGELDRDAFIGELVDAAHFLANMAVAAGCTDSEWRRRYRRKRRLNAKRQREGYDGRNKCQGCGRALDDPAVRCTTERCAA